ncbi:MAG: RDD family protein [Desulfobacteraceae bacterium]|nr:RDD family protein [Desulfobacteraceae bacterium]
MPWYYKDGETQIGPIEKKDLQQLFKEKKINSQTLIRKADHQDWKPLAEFELPKKPQDAQEPPVEQRQDHHRDPAMEQTGVDPDRSAPPPPTKVCSKCGGSFPRDQVIEFSGQAICGACKPLYVQKMREGVESFKTQKYAGFWIRFVAKTIDGIILALAQWIIIIPLYLIMEVPIVDTSNQLSASGYFLIMGLQNIIGIIIQASYNTYFIGKFRATPGKMACKLQVIMPDGGQVSYLRALGRNFAEWISGITLCIGYIIAGFDKEKRSLHDYLCSTRVVKKQAVRIKGSDFP